MRRSHILRTRGHSTHLCNTQLHYTNNLSLCWNSNHLCTHLAKDMGISLCSSNECASIPHQASTFLELSHHQHHKSYREGMPNRFQARNRSNYSKFKKQREWDVIEILALQDVVAWKMLRSSANICLLFHAKLTGSRLRSGISFAWAWSANALTPRRIISTRRAFITKVSSVAAVVTGVASSAVDCVALAIIARIARRARNGTLRYAWTYTWLGLNSNVHTKAPWK